MYPPADFSLLHLCGPYLNLAVVPIAGLLAAALVAVLQSDHRWFTKGALALAALLASQTVPPLVNPWWGADIDLAAWIALTVTAMVVVINRDDRVTLFSAVTGTPGSGPRPSSSPE